MKTREKMMSGQVKYLNKLFNKLLGRRPSVPAPLLSETDIAIIGLAGRYPQAETLDQLWENLSAGVDCITEIPAERWPHHHYFDSQVGVFGKTYSKWGGFIEGVEFFDPQFFNIAPREAAVQDPQERLFLQCAYTVLEDAGYTRQALNAQGAVGVFVGVQYQDYKFFSTDDIQVAALPGSIANRVSWFCNFTGPSITLDTMCSASLSAIHLACNSILQGDCHSAIAGGVNLTLHPVKYLIHAQGRFSSSHGRCMAFGDRGDGYVPAEGIGAVLLKPLSAAVADRDNIYAVIKGSAINHGGYARGFTVPKASAQRAVIQSALTKARVDPEAINYIEAHGTGTILGDYVEFDGLTQAYAGKRSGSQEKICAIGSIKSNIGHCESAAGIAGLTKILLQLKHQQLVPSLHSQQLNRSIDFASSRFVVPQENQRWEPVVVMRQGKAVRYPRTAGLSAFGAGGSNAHLIVQEYQQAPPETPPSRSSCYGLLLSAKTQPQLREKAEALLAYVQKHQFSDRDLPNLAFTLSEGREAMMYRLAIRVASMDEVIAGLTHFLQQAPASTGAWLGQVKAAKQEETPARQPLPEALDGAQLDAALSAWVSGASIDWRSLFRHSSVRRISLPTYPFARKRTWMPGSDFGLSPEAARQPVASLLTLVAREPTHTRFQARFSGQELFLQHHKINGQAVLPGVVYLEMAYQALEQVATEPVCGVRIENLFWLRPVVYSGQPLVLTVELVPEAAGIYAFRVCTGAKEESLLEHCRARLLLPETPVVDTPVDLSPREGTLVPASRIYSCFSGLGIDYGWSHQRLEALFPTAAGVLAKLDSQPRQDEQAYRLIPGILDSALQATLGLSLNAQGALSGEQQLAVPFAVDVVEIFAPLQPLAWVWVQPQDSMGQDVHARISKCDIKLCNMQGDVVIRVRGYSARPGLKPVAAQVTAPVSTPTCALYAPVWQPIEQHADAGRPRRHIVIFGEAEQALYQAQRERGHALEAHLLQVASGDIATRYQEYTRQLVTFLQAIVAQPQEQGVLVQLVAGQSYDSYLLQGLYALLRSAQAEFPWLKTQLLTLAETTTPSALAQALSECVSLPATRIDFQAARPQLQRYQLLETPAAQGDTLWQADATYLITGGTGALGRLFTREILAKAPRASVVLMGRTALSAEGREWLASLPDAGRQVVWYGVDLADLSALKAAIEEINRTLPPVRGVIHAAGKVDDRRLAAQTPQKMVPVLAPKVAGTLNLDLATKDLPLDFMVFFSSISAVFGNAGQVDYAAGNGFMDSYAHYRQKLVGLHQRAGASISINWPYWQAGGMGLDERYLERMRARTGLHPLPAVAGIQAFYQALRTGQRQLVVLYGEQGKIQTTLPDILPTVVQASAPAASPQIGVPPVSAASVAVPDIAALKKIVSTLLGVEAQDIDEEAEFETLGFDSVSLNELISAIRTRYAIELRITDLYEHASLRELLTFMTQGIAPASAPRAPAVTPDIAALKKIVSTLLGVEAQDIDIDAGFEMLGFDSVTLSEFAGLLKTQYDVAVSITDLYEHATIRALLSFMAQNRPVAGAPQQAVDGSAQWMADQPQLAAQGYYPASSIQQVMLQKIAAETPGLGLYQPVLIYEVNDPQLNTAALQQALSSLVQRYDNLNSEFCQVAGRFFQRTRPGREEDMALPCEDLRHLSAAEQQRKLLDEVKRAFHLSSQRASRTATLRTMLYRLSQSRWALLFATHHCVLDGWSFTQFINALEKAYRQLVTGKPVAVSPYQDRFRERVALELAAGQQRALQEMRRALLAGHRSLGLVPRYPVSADPFDQIVSEVQQLDAASVAQLKVWASRHKLPLKGVFLSCFYELLGRHCQTRHVTIELVCNGRTPQIEDVFGQMGVYWSWVPVCCQLGVDGRPDPAVLKQKLLQAEESALHPWHAQPQPTDEAAFNFIQFASGGGESGYFQLHHMYDRFHHPIKLLVSVDESDGAATLTLDFVARYFSATERSQISQQYKALLLTMVQPALVQLVGGAL